jgi:hypothetical protein
MNPETMNHPELLTYGQPESLNENKTTLVLHCVGCGKFKDKRSRSKKCTVCLFHMTTEEAIDRGFIQA